MRISIIGLGYVGLVTGVCLAKLGNEISFIEINSDKVEAVNKGSAPFYEEGMEEMLREVDFQAATDYTQAQKSELIFICVGTASGYDGSLSLEQVNSAAEQLTDVLKKKANYCVVCVKSTVPPGTTEEVVIPVLERSGKRAGADFGVCMNPEFLREGKALHDFMNPARIIIGEYDTRSGDRLAELYKDFRAPTLRTSPRAAEMIKLASNAFLATKISYINEIGNICKKFGIDVYEVAKAMGFDDRIGSKFLNAGLGFGGSCLPKDLRGLIARAKEVGYQAKILEEVLNVNDEQASKAIELLKKHVPLKKSTVGILGLAFKPGTDDIRDSRALKIVESLLQEGAKVRAYDPLAVENFRKLFPQVKYSSKEEVLACDAIMIVTEWEEFNELDYRGKVVVDGRRVPKAMQARIYEGICW
jgi:UDPglucose 6-dehydrogenase